MNMMAIDVKFRFIEKQIFTQFSKICFDMQGLVNHQCNYPFIKKTAGLITCHISKLFVSQFQQK